MKYFMHKETKEVVDVQNGLAVVFIDGDNWQEVRLTDTFADLVKYGEWMPVEGEK